MSPSVKSSCPNCEYERGTSGKPVADGERMNCLECGTSWKELSGAPALRHDSKNQEQTLNVLRELARKGSSTHEHETAYASDNSNRSNHWTAALHTAFFALALVGGIGFTGWILGTPATEKSMLDNTISVSGIKVREQIGRDGRKVITAVGSIRNSTDRHHAIPRVTIILKRKDGGEIVRWRYNPPASSISPGGKTRFASSIQYDTPVVAYAEAIIE